MKLHPPTRWRRLSALTAAIAASMTIAGSEEAPDFFDIIGKSPADVAASMDSPYQTYEPELLLSGFIGTPMSRGHREQFLNELRGIAGKEPAGYLPKLCLALLLEEDGHFDEALAVTRNINPAWKTPRAREIGLLWKAGKAHEAEQLATGVPVANPWDSRWLSLVAIALNRNRPEEAMQLLTFLETLVSVSPRERHALAIQHLSIARRTGEIDRLITSTPSPALRAVWLVELDRKAEALACVNEAGAASSAGDIALLALAFPKEALVFEKAQQFLKSDNLSSDERLTVLRSFQSHPEQRVELWIDMSAGHEETAESTDPSKSGINSSLKDRMRARCLELLKTHPKSIRLKWIAAQLTSPENPEAKAMLREVACAFQENPDPAFSDPAQGALKLLAGQSSAEELREILFGAPGFAELPPQVRLRYLMEAELDFDVIEVVKSCSFTEPGQDYIGSAIRNYLGRRDNNHLIHDEVLALLLDRLPDLVLGSPEKKDLSRQSDTESWLTFFGTRISDKSRLTDAIQSLLEKASERGPEVRQQVLGGLPEFTWSLPALQVTRPEKKPRPTIPDSPAYQLASVFTPANPAKIGQGEELGAMPSGLDPLLWANPSDGMRFLINSPWTQNLRGITDRKQFDPALQAKLRKLFDNQPSRTVIYDLLVTSGRIECPDPEIKAAAENRVAALIPSREEDPAIAMYLFTQRQLKKTPLEQCLPLLDDLKSFPRQARGRVLHFIGPHQRFTRPDRGIEVNYEVIREKLGFQIPAQPPGPPKTPDAYDRLQFFIEGGQQASPEAVTLAKDVLSTFVDSGKAEPSPTENIAVATLTTAKRFDEFLEELKSRMDKAGKSELEVQRALFRVHLYSIIHSNGEAEPFAKRVFALDPTDRQAAREVLESALREKDPELTLKCLDVFARESPSRLAAALKPRSDSYGRTTSRGPLELFIGERARDLVQTLMRAPLATEDPNTSYRSYDAPTLIPLYLHVARHDPDHLKQLLRWARALGPANAQQLLSLADQLKSRNQESLALDLLVEAFFVAPASEASPKLRFKPETTRILPDSNSFPLSSFSSSGWAKRLMETESGKAAPEPGNGTRLLIALSADPQPETWDRLVPGFIAALPVASQPEIRRQLESQMDQLTSAPALKIHLQKQRGESNRAPATLHSLSNKLQLASQARDRASLNSLWVEAKPLLESSPAKARLDFLSYATSGFACLAEPAVWNEFIAAVAKADGFAENWAARYADLSQFDISSERLADIARLVLPALQPGEKNSTTVLQLFTPVATAEIPDLALLNQFRPWIERSNSNQSRRPRLPARIQWLDLLSSDPAGVCPVIDPHLEPDGGWSVDWSLAGYQGTRQDLPSTRTFAFLSGQFDVEILAGPAAERMKRVAIVPKAAVTGTMKLSLPDGSKVMAAIVRQSPGDIVRWSHPVVIDASRSGEAVAFTPVATGNASGTISSSVIPSGGPFGTGDAIGFHLTSGSSADLARLVWEEGPAPVVSGWFLQYPASGNLRLSFRSADNKEVGTGQLDSGDYEIDSLPFWRRFKTPADLRVPSGTVTVMLEYYGGYGNRPVIFSVADVRALPPAPVEMPAGFATLGRIPGSIDQFAFDLSGNRIAVGSGRAGVGVFDFTTHQFSGWIPLETDRGYTQVTWLALSGDRLVCAEITGEVHLISLSKRSARMIRKTEDLSSTPNSNNLFSLSHDGRFLAWRGIMAGLRIAELGNEGIISERLMETLQLYWLRFDDEKKTLIAYGGENLYTLPLDNWQKADLKAERLTTPPPLWGHPSEILELGKSWRDEARQVTFRTGSEKIRYDPSSRYLALPDGIVAGDREGLPFFISSFGRVIRIDTEKLEGYVSPARK